MKFNEKDVIVDASEVDWDDYRDRTADYINQLENDVNGKLNNGELTYEEVPNYIHKKLGVRI